MRTAIFNPYNRPVDELPTIYGFNNGGPPGFVDAVLIAQDGTVLGGHCCSAECFMPIDLGVIEGHRLDRHEGFQKHYPDGYRMAFVGYAEVDTNEGLKAAFRAHEALSPPPHTKEPSDE